ncbi:MAG: hypothetical protein Q9160_001800 [Pyrenula sp. 1 TL-2023]
MNLEASSWPQSAGDDPMAGITTDEDFTNFLELDNDFSLDTLRDDANMNSMEALDFEHLGLNTSNGDTLQSTMVWDTQNSADLPDTNCNQATAPLSTFPEHNYNPQPATNAFMRQPAIPPTPTSDDIQGGTAYYTSSARYPHTSYGLHHTQIDLNAYTPLVSPAVTPADLTLRMPEYTAPGEYFSPLISPAIEAQHPRDRSNLRNNLGSGAETMLSPVDFPAPTTTSAPATPALRKSRRKATDSARSTARSVRQSPIVKSQKKKRGSANLSPVIAELVRAEYPISAAKLTTSSNAGSGVVSSGSSAQDSVSPEPLSDALMPPPAVPRSAGRSPMITASNRRSSTDSNEPATPATLMKLQSTQLRSPRSNGKANEQSVVQMDDFQLPDAATSLSPTADSNHDSYDQVTPTISAKTPRLGSQKTPRARPTSSAGPSPQIEPVMSPIDLEQPGSKVGGAGRGGKKRQTTGSSQMSPALRPKISPSIKPLMPQGSISAETSALYLASKSNYQNIIEGTHLPGVSYPEALAENLSSKRTSHKIAEQGRRNRINTALKEIEALLPQSPTIGSKKEKLGKESPDSDKAGSNNQSNSKASTVEMAISYIKELQGQLAETKAKLDVAEEKLANRMSSTEKDPPASE